MKENRREFAVFGNFTVIDFNRVIDIKEKLSSYHFELKAYDDYIRMDANPQAITPEPRPYIESREKGIKIFFGISRINIDEISENALSDEDYVILIKEVMQSVFTVGEDAFIRLALNGQIQIPEWKEGNDLSEKLLHKNSICEQGNEINLRVNSKTFSEKLNCSINRITSIQKQDAVLDVRNSPIVVYDYNTELLTQRAFSFEDVNQFLIEAMNFRQQVIKEFNHD